MMDLVRGCSPDIDTETRREHGDTSTETDSCQRWSWTSRRMCKLSATCEWWTSSSTSHDERIMTAIARSNARAMSKVMVNATLWTLIDRPTWRRTFRTMTERADFFQDQAVLVQWSVWFLHVYELTSLASDGAVHVRGGVINFRLIFPQVVFSPICSQSFTDIDARSAMAR